ncbi:DNA polymerase IV [Spirosoma sp. KNUC1025]|uniref:DNA polymerase IV n=1 Tax=Spirosoma sp. KNUC1025 TaxID=2894082 RepID=UPI0038635A79|nr:DNA polymerase IV [Spirosoma sp. KNUC1025]
MEQPENRKIIHIDMDAFYASVEQRDNPDLRGKPVAVGGAGLRGVVAAASYEARRFGVRSAMASSMAVRKCPNLMFVKPRFEVYKEVSRQIRCIFEQYTLLIEPLSLDEAYLDVTENLANHSSATQTALAIKDQIRQETGLTASAGVSYNKFLAKLASDYNKPDGLYVIKPHQGLAFVESLNVEQFHGIGRVTAARMNELGIFTGLDLRHRTEAFLTQTFGKVGHHYYLIARAIDPRPVTPNRIRKSVGAETTFEQDLQEHSALIEAITPLVDRVWDYCERMQIVGRTVTLKVKYANFNQITRSRSLIHAVPDKPGLWRILLELLESILPLSQGIRLLGVSLSSLQEKDATPTNGQLRLNL